MNRFYLDTNILIFILQKDKDDISNEVHDILTDYSTLLYASSVAIKELIFLFRIGKIAPLVQCKSENDIIHELKSTYGIEMVLFSDSHFSKYVELSILKGHKDMNDHSIVAQAIADKIPLISSDHEFYNYTAQGLDFIFNKR